MTLPIISTEALCETQALALWRNYWSPGGLELTHSTAAAMHLPSGSHVLDAGCGTGESSLYLLDTLRWNVLAVDNDEFGLVLARDKAKQTGHELQTLNANVLHLPFADASFDGVFSQGTVFMFQEERPELLREFQRVLKPGGVLGLGEPMLTRPGKSEVHPEMITLDETRQLVQDAGFEINLASLHPDGKKMWHDFHAPHLNRDGSIRRHLMKSLVEYWQNEGNDLLSIGVVIARKS